MAESKVESRKSRAALETQSPAQSPLAIEHIIQDGGTPGIEEFARELGAEFYRDGKLVFGSRPSTLDFIGSPFTASPTLDSTHPKILFVDMVCAEKGMGALLEACRILRDPGVGFHCEVVGRAPSVVEEQTFLHFIRDHYLGEQVMLTGPLHYEAKWQAYAAADVFCFLTFYSAESFGLVAVEAMMSGLPVVSTNWRGLPDIVVEGETGYLVPPCDAASVADRLVLLIKDPELRKRMEEAGRRRYEENFTVERLRKNMEQCLLRLN